MAVHFRLQRFLAASLYNSHPVALEPVHDSFCAPVSLRRAALGISMSIYIPGSALCPRKASGRLSQIVHRRVHGFFFLYSGVIMSYQHIQTPGGDRIVVKPDGSIQASEQPIIPYIEGDGIGADITPVMIQVVDAAVQKAYGNRRKIQWMEVYAGEKSAEVY